MFVNVYLSDAVICSAQLLQILLNDGIGEIINKKYLYKSKAFISNISLEAFYSISNKTFFTVLKIKFQSFDFIQYTEQKYFKAQFFVFFFKFDTQEDIKSCTRYKLKIHFIGYNLILSRQFTL